eukprot:2850391-Rhodomonas_salina.2
MATAFWTRRGICVAELEDSQGTAAKPSCGQALQLSSTTAPGSNLLDHPLMIARDLSRDACETAADD